MQIFTSSHTPLIPSKAPREAGGVAHAHHLQPCCRNTCHVEETFRGAVGEAGMGQPAPAKWPQRRPPCQALGQASIASRRMASTSERDTTSSSGVLHLLLLCLHLFCNGVFKWINMQAGASAQSTALLVVGLFWFKREVSLNLQPGKDSGAGLLLHE